MHLNSELKFVSTLYIFLANKSLQNKTFQLHFIISYNYTLTALKTVAYSEATGTYLCSAVVRTMVKLTLLKD